MTVTNIIKLGTKIILLPAYSHSARYSLLAVARLLTCPIKRRYLSFTVIGHNGDG
jgi:hypothetical protein